MGPMTLTSRRALVIMSAIAAVALGAALLLAYGPWRASPDDQPGLDARGPKATQAAQPTPAPSEATEGEGGESAEELIEEAQEQAEGTEHRNEAFEKAKREGKTGQQRAPTVTAAAPGWAGEFPMDTQWDD